MKANLVMRALALVAATISGWIPAHAGGDEHFCDPPGVERLEAWVNPANIPWTVNDGVSALIFVPGFPPRTCQGGIPIDKQAGMQSIYSAAGAWTAADSTFSIAKIPGMISMTVQQYTGGVSFIGNDGINVVTFHEPPSIFAMFGGPMALAFTPVTPDQTGKILDVDIAFNCRSIDAATSRPYWSFVEDNLAFQRTFASNAGTGTVAPFLGFADIQGVATHEFGHFAGLAHSLLDSSASSTQSLFPTMFPFAQVQPYSQILSIPIGSCGFLSSFATGSGTRFGGILGLSARSLEPDDVAAIQEAYPQAAFSATHGSIVGTVFRNNLSTPELGASAVAVKSDEPDVVRVGSLSYTGGSYTIRGLTPGTYYAYVEPVSQRPTTSFPTGYYFDDNPQNFTVPNFVFLGPSGCVPIPPLQYFPIDVFDANELISTSEFSFATAAPITVVAGQQSTASFLVAGGDDLLTVRLSGTNNYQCPRGLIVVPLGGVYPSVEITVNAGPAAAGKRYSIYMDTARSSTIVNGQLRLVSAVLTSGIVPGSGIVTFVLPLSASDAFNNYFLQASVGVNADQRFSNCLNVWMSNP